MTVLNHLHKAAGATLGERNGRVVPESYGSLDAAYRAMRRTIVMSDYSHLSRYLIEGPEAFDFLDLVLSGDVGSLRDQQGLFTLLLDEKGAILSDCYVLNDDERYLLLCEHLNDDELGTWLDRHRGEHDVTITSITDSNACLLFEGPYSWELMAEIFGRDIAGMPFMEFYKPVDDAYVFRCGKHGEFAYKVVLPEDQAVALWDRARGLAGKYDLVPAGLDVQCLCRIENPCWHAPRFAAVARNPIELQMQWMVRFDKADFIGKEALAESRETSATRRMIGFVATEDVSLAPGDGIFHKDKQIGSVIDAAYSSEAKSVCGLAMIDQAYAYAGLDDYRAFSTTKGTIPITTKALPFLSNFSFAVNPAVHSYVNPAKHKNMFAQIEAEAAARRVAGAQG
jgi:glycine cleavage system aminomethyltransferase T